MARDRANIRTDIWADGDWRVLDFEAQHLYLLLLSSPTLNYVGVADWRPGRIAQLADGLTTERVIATAARLQAQGFVLADDETEEILVRSFVKHDGLLKQPKLAVSMANAFGATASNAIRAVVAYEVQKLRERDADLAAWRVKQVQTVLDAKGSPIEDFTHGFTPTVTPNVGQAQGVPTTTATTTATSTSRSAPSARELEPRFEEAWAHWPKKTERKKSLEKFVAKAKARPVSDLVSDIIRFGDAYAATTEKQFVPALNVWLNGERWTDELPGVAANVIPGAKPKKVFKAHAD